MPDAYYVAAVSGGADSMAMLHMLWQEKPKALWVCHLHHGLRGAEADRDAAFVQEICREWGIRCELRFENAAAAAKRLSCSVEDAGRRLRYAFFEQTADRLAQQEGIDPSLVRIATAHTKSDNAETILMHLIRGAGLHGLTGIPPERGRLIRPVLDYTREQIERYCAEHGIAYIQDSTNRDDTYTRNRIRHTLLPLLREENPAIEQTLTRMASLLRGEDQLLDALAAPYASGVDEWEREPIAAQPKALRNRIARGIFARCGLTPDADRIERLDRCFCEGQGVVPVDATRQLRVTPKRILLEAVGEPIPEPTPAVFGEALFGGWQVILQPIDDVSAISKKIAEKHLKNTLDGDTIQGTLYWSVRQPGDRVAVAGHTGSKTLKKWMNEHALPDRDRYPILRDAAGVVLIPGVGCAARCAVTEKTKRMLQASVQRMTKETLTDRRVGWKKNEVTSMSNLRNDVGSVLVSEEALQARIAELGAQITADYGDEPVLMIGVLKGSVIFMADLMRAVDLNVSIEFMAVSSYGSGTQTSGQVQVIKDLSHPIEGKNVLIVEDILDSGVTLSFLRKLLESRQPKSIRICTLLDKPERRKANIVPDYTGFTVPDEFVVGYGLDYDEAYRHLPFIGVLKREVYEK